jgi:hypothetical protein
MALLEKAKESLDKFGTKVVAIVGDNHSGIQKVSTTMNCWFIYVSHFPLGNRRFL